MRKEKIFTNKGLINIGDSINVSFVGMEEEVYYSYVYDADTNYIYILSPTDNLGRKAHIKKLDKVCVIGLSKNKERIGFESTVVDIINNELNTIYKIQKSSDYYKYELRESFRVDVLLKANCIVQESQTIECSLLNISSSGAKISMGIFVSLQSLVRIMFKIDNTMLQLNSKIVRATKIDTKTFHYGVEFVEIKEKDREYIVKFCLKKQREILSARRGV